MSSYFSGILRSYCQVEVASIEEQAYYEFNNSLPDPVILAIAGFHPLEGSILVEISPSAAYGMIDRLLGGPGRNVDTSRSFTEIELALMERVIKQILGFVRDSWSNVIEIQPELQRIETSSQFTQIVAPNETIVIITLNVVINDVSGMINFCIPYVVLEPIIKQLSTKYWFSSQKSGTSDEQSMEEVKARIEKTPLELRGVLGETYLSLSDVMDLQVGDVIQLDQKINEEVRVKIENITRFYGVLGARKNKLAIKINRIRKEEVMEDE